MWPAVAMKGCPSYLGCYSGAGLDANSASDVEWRWLEQSYFEEPGTVVLRTSKRTGVCADSVARLVFSTDIFTQTMAIVGRACEDSGVARIPGQLVARNLSRS